HGNTGLQNSIARAHDMMGVTLVEQGNLAEALTAYRDGLAIRVHLSETEPKNNEWHIALSASYQKVGSVLVAQGNLAEALTAYRDSLAIVERLAKADTGNVQWQVEVVWSNWHLARIGDEAPRRWAFIVATLGR